jgi:hypothetical protein
MKTGLPAIGNLLGLQLWGEDQFCASPTNAFHRRAAPNAALWIKQRSCTATRIALASISATLS